MNIQEATALGIIIGAIVAPFVKIIISLFKKENKDDNKNLTYKEFLTEKDTIYCDMEMKIKEVKCEMATKESVQHLAEGFEKLEKKFDSFEAKMGEKLEQIVVNIAVLAERRNQPRN